MSLKKYKSKRDLKKSKEPKALLKKSKGKELAFVVQKHAARRLHYDFRIEVEGVLKSWAIPKGPSLNPNERRLAIMVEDHPYDYKDFEGVIESGYGAGEVLIWDKGTYSVEDLSGKEAQKKILEGLKKGEIRFQLHGKKLQGEFVMVRINEEKNEWLFIKKRDDFATQENVLEKRRSVVSKKTLEDSEELWEKAPKKKMPHKIVPMLSTLVDAPFNHEDWIFEIKMDGYRAVAEVEKTKISLYSRNLLSFNERFPQIVENLKALKTEAILDGEIVALDSQGISRFQLLQNVKEEPQNLYYFVFDILYYRGHDLRALPLIERKAILKEALEPIQNSDVHFHDHIEEKGVAFFRLCEKKGIEGIIGKKKASPYLEGKRTKEWVKIKALLRQEAIICGFTEPKGSRKDFGALILGMYKKGKLVYIGHAGTGFTEKKLSEIKKLLLPLVQKESPFEKPSKTHTKVTWVKPKILCEVAFSEWTKEGIMRQPVFIGLRMDKDPKAVIKEEPIQFEKVVKKKETKASFTNLDKLYFPKDGLTKGDVIHYYESISKVILPYLKDRPQSLKRFPDGIEGENFFQKNLEKAPSWIQTVKIQHEDKIVNYLLIQDVDSLLYAANLGCIELHPFFSRKSALEYPDFLVFDLDPESISFDRVVEVAQVLHEVLEEYGVSSVCKTSGATGLHICVPLGAKYTFQQAKDFANLIALITFKKIPKISSLERSPQKRQKKVYIDYLQNNPHQTIVAPYSLRAFPKAPVSTPLEWSEVKKGLTPLDFTMKNFLKRLKKKGDLFKPILGKGISIEKALKKIESTHRSRRK